MIEQSWVPVEDALLAAALAALGFQVKAKVGLMPDAPTQAAHKTVTYHVSPTSGDGKAAHELIIPWKHGILIKEQPNHPLIAALMGIETRRVLAEWKAGQIGMPHIVRLPGSKLCRAIPPSSRSQNADLTPHLLGGALQMPWDHAAAAIVAGHGITALGPQACSVTLRGAFSDVTTAANLAAAAGQIEQDGRKSVTTILPGWPAGEHPFLYAFAAIGQARVLKEIALKADPTLHLAAKSSGKVALVSQSIMDGSGTEKDHVARHIR